MTEKQIPVIEISDDSDFQSQMGIDQWAAIYDQDIPSDASSLNLLSNDEIFNLIKEFGSNHGSQIQPIWIQDEMVPELPAPELESQAPEPQVPEPELPVSIPEPKVMLMIPEISRMKESLSFSENPFDDVEPLPLKSKKDKKVKKNKRAPKKSKRAFY